MFAGGPGWQEIIIVLFVVLILFGAKRIPDIASGLGKGIRDFKKALKDTQDEITRESGNSDKKIEEKKSDD